MSFVAALLCSALALQDEERLRVDEEDENFMRHWAAALAEGDGRRLLTLFDDAHKKKGAKLFRSDPDVPLWIPLPRALAPRLAALPEKIRAPWETVAFEALENVRDPERRRELAETWAATRAGRDTLGALANEDFDRGDLIAAVRAWTRLLEVEPTPELALRLARAHALRGDAAAVADLAVRAKAGGWSGAVRVGARRLPLAEALAALPCAAPAAAVAKGAAPTAELPIGRLELKADGNAYGSRQHAAMIPAVGVVDGRELVVYTNGIRVTAVDPARADGGSLESAVVWRHPRENFIRYGLPWSHTQGHARPPAGVVLADGRIFANVFTAQARQTRRMRRNEDAFEGPSAIRALDARTGELIWDTDAVEVSDSDGEPMKRITQFFDRRYVCFCGPPVVRGDRLYVPAMSSPKDGREAFVVCFRSSDGEPLWKTSIAAFASSQDVLSVTAIAEEDGTLAVATNFGVVAALDAATGRIEWLHSYLEQADRAGGRPLASPPVIFGSRIVVLPQDAVAPLAFDRWTGRTAAWPETAVAWEDVDTLVGRSGDWLVFAGRRSCALRMSDGRVADLGEEASASSGRPALAGGRLYVPSRASLRVFETAGWTQVDARPWAGGSQGGNVAPGASFCAVLGDKLELWTGEGFLAGEEPPALLRRAGAFEGAGRAKDAIGALEKVLLQTEGDAAGLLRERIDKLRELPDPK